MLDADTVMTVARNVNPNSKDVNVRRGTRMALLNGILKLQNMFLSDEN